jgi:hypothetical protein
MSARFAGIVLSRANPSLASWSRETQHLKVGKTSIMFYLPLYIYAVVSTTFDAVPNEACHVQANQYGCQVALIVHARGREERRECYY